ncbi:Ig-like domain-containing protein [Halobaculum sp. CBA1158]|uniref:Ig-like domain-containing protein n=1 Tax=Halobaculum sp. CBA1158 TaxID=2904243 RepID=UPI001F361862|nr:Ig-like domain-containing protein [Halobaculum sp. CBA1158]UIP01146.1 Ig-like domain-containing protein [Halobaculum sp. CBA1158]
MSRGGSDGSPERERAVTVQIGAVILFGFLIVALSTYQATVVPDQNREVEFLHNQEVQTDMVELSNGIVATGRTGDATPTTVSLGTRYPSRAFFVNPPPASGTLRTNGSTPNATLEGVEVVGDSEANDYWGTAGSFDTRFLTYEPRYNLYREAPTTRYEPGGLRNEFPSGRSLNVTDQQLIDGDRITLVLVRGDLDRNGVSSVSVDPSAVSVVTRRERVNGTMDITVPTTRSAAEWAGPELLDVENNGYVESVSPGPVADTVTVELNDSRNYSLGIAVVDVGPSDRESPDPAYIDVERAPGTTSVGDTREVVVEVRDRYGNPVSDVAVEGETNASGELADSSVVTDGEGRAVFEYTPDATGDETLNFSYDGLGGFDASTPEDADTTVGVNAGSGGGDGSANDPNPPDSVVLVDSYRKQNDNSIAVLELENRGGQTVNSSRARINFFAQSGGNNPTQAVVTTAAESPTLDIGGPFEDATIEFQPNVTRYVCYDYDAALNQDEFFVTTYEFDNGLNEQYFVGLNDQRTVSCGAAGGGGGGSTADLQYVSGSGTTSSPDGDGSGVVFTLENTAGQEMDITNLTVDDTTSGSTAGYVENNGSDGQYNREAFFNVVGDPTARNDPEDGYIEEGPRIDIGQTAVLDNLAQLADGDTADVYLYQFVNGGGSPRDLSGETVTVTVGYELADGTTGTYTFSFTA